MKHAISRDTSADAKHASAPVSHPRLAYLPPSSAKSLGAFFHQPARRVSTRPPLVVIHGISREAEEQARAFVPVAETLGVPLLAPFFPKSRHRHYQRLDVGENPSLPAFLQLLEEAARDTGIDFNRVDLFGYSGGAQFVHRFAMRHPGRARRLLLTAAGWYTMPDVERPYPFGMAGKDGGIHPHIDIDGFLALPMKVVVGERDVARDRAFRRGDELDEVQGLNRVARAENWTQAVRRAAAARGVAAEIFFQTLPDCAHSFRNCFERGGLGGLATEWFSGSDRVAPIQQPN